VCVCVCVCVSPFSFSLVYLVAVGPYRNRLNLLPLTRDSQGPRERDWLTFKSTCLFNDAQNSGARQEKK
jgi:hypothetical protein